jgi:hypothetical protein
MTLALLGSIFIILGIAVLALAAALPILYGLRMRAQTARPSTSALGRATQVERVSA